MRRMSVSFTSRWLLSSVRLLIGSTTGPGRQHRVVHHHEMLLQPVQTFAAGRGEGLKGKIAWTRGHRNLTRFD